MDSLAHLPFYYSQVLSNSPCQTASAHMFSHTWQLPNWHVIDLRSSLDPSHACPFIVHNISAL